MVGGVRGDGSAGSLCYAWVLTHGPVVKFNGSSPSFKCLECPPSTLCSQCRVSKITNFDKARGAAGLRKVYLLQTRRVHVERLIRSEFLTNFRPPFDLSKSI